MCIYPHVTSKYICNCLTWWWNRVFVTIRLCSWQQWGIPSPRIFLAPKPKRPVTFLNCWSMAVVQPMFMSPCTIRISFMCRPLIGDSSCLQNDSVISSLDSEVGAYNYIILILNGCACIFSIIILSWIALYPSTDPLADLNSKSATQLRLSESFPAKNMELSEFWQNAYFLSSVFLIIPLCPTCRIAFLFHWCVIFRYEEVPAFLVPIWIFLRNLISYDIIQGN